MSIIMFLIVGVIIDVPWWYWVIYAIASIYKISMKDED